MYLLLQKRPAMYYQYHSQNVPEGVAEMMSYLHKNISFHVVCICKLTLRNEATN